MLCRSGPGGGSVLPCTLTAVLVNNQNKRLGTQQTQDGLCEVSSLSLRGGGDGRRRRRGPCPWETKHNDYI